jgi:ribonuclease HI
LEDIQAHFISGFHSLYQTDQISCQLTPPPLPCWGALLSPDEANSIASPPLDSEILSALNSMKSFKAPGNDGLHAGFFQRFWMIVGPSVKTAVKNIFSTGIMPPNLNQTLIALVPKQQGPETLNHYRPISLCNTVYKIITKLLVLRIKPYLLALVSPFQTAFVSGRRGSDNLIIAQELVYTLRKKRGKQGFMIVKIDLEKAFDRMEWSFVRRVLIHFGFPPTIIKLIMSCISSTSTSLLFNGSKLSPFLASRGLRQGDPLSPYLFLLCMEFLGALIDRKCDSGDWTKVKASRGGPGFSHVFFADDLLLFAKANDRNCAAIVNVLDEFCSMSGQKVSYTKSRIFFSPNVPVSTKHSICDYMGFLPTDSLGKYLGFPLLHKRQSSSDFHIITERVQAKLAGWKSKLLSPAGKLVLIQSAVTPILEYVMQCMSVPLKVCNSIDKLCRDFLWGSTLEKRKMHLVSWKKVTVHKSLGGLGIFSMRDRNKALLAKLCWRISTDHTSPWAQMLTQKYLCPSRLTPSGKKLPCSRIWAACKLGGIIFTQGIKWHIQNGNHVLFWLDWWLPSGPLHTLISGPLSPDDLSLTVADVHPFGGQWLLDKLSFVLPDHLLLELLATPFSSNPLSNDLVLWAFSSNGAFSLHSAYLLSKGFIPAKPSPSLSTSWIWKAGTTPRIKFFLWLCFHHSLPTCDVLAHRGISLSPQCSLCHSSIETITHVLRDCPVAHGFWLWLGVPGSTLNFFTSSFSCWLEQNCTSNAHSVQHRLPWKILFPFAIWQLWLHRNQFLFSKGIIDTGFLHQCVTKGVEFAVIVPNHLLRTPCIPKRIKWLKPTAGWVKLNTDGAYSSSCGLAGGGGLLRDSNGNWIHGFARFLGNCSSTIAELWALKDGLTLAHSLGFSLISIELDAEMVVLLLKNPSTVNLVMEPLLSDYRHLLQLFDNPVVQHVYREANQCTDALATLGLNLHVSFMDFVHPPSVVETLLAFDKAELFCTRLFCA